MFNANKLVNTHANLIAFANNIDRVRNIVIVCGYRSDEEQERLFISGLSKKRGGCSKHNKLPSMAIDIAPYPINWKDTNEFYYLAGIAESVAFDMNIKIIWGGDWDNDNDLNDQTFMDLGHYQLEE